MVLHSPSTPSFYEFFAGGGMARAGLGEAWRCLFANDFDQKKVAAYQANWGDREIHPGDIHNVKVGHLPGQADLVWASFPCQDLSLAGGGAGLRGNRSGTFWPFWSLVKQLSKEGRAPKAVVLENVCGTLTSHGGKDFRAICNALQSEGYLVGALVADAVLFVPHSRPRLFFIGIRSDSPSLQEVSVGAPNPIWHTGGLIRAYEQLPAKVKADWIWWDIPTPRKRNTSLVDIIEDEPSDVSWHDDKETRKLLAMMSPLHQRKISNATALKRKIVGTIYKRTRRDENGERVQRAEVRFDEVAGCLRTPAGGSSRQIVIVVDRGKVRSRLISARETARLMGLPDSYVLPDKYNEAYHLTGDGVAVPVVQHLSETILLPIIKPMLGRLVA